jgi:hypothetical protein
MTCPAGVSGHRRLDYKMDMLREDDRRRMDDLSHRIRSRHSDDMGARSARSKANARGPRSKDSLEATLHSSLAWLGDAAARASSCSSPALSKRKGASSTSGADTLGGGRGARSCGSRAQGRVGQPRRSSTVAATVVSEREDRPASRGRLASSSASGSFSSPSLGGIGENPLKSNAPLGAGAPAVQCATSTLAGARRPRR